MPTSAILCRRDRFARSTDLEPLEGRRLLSVSVPTRAPSIEAAIEAAGVVLPIQHTVLPESAVVAARSAVASAVGSSFNIDFNFSDSTTAAQRAIFNQAADIWESVLLGDVPDVMVNGTLVDDVRIDADVAGIDGPGGTLGYAGPRRLRPASQGFLPATGAMTFDEVDVAGLINNGTFLSTVLHEMGHVLGIGTIWSELGLLSGDNTGTPRFTGPAAAGEYDRLSKNSQSSVDVESTGGSGTRYAHWRETTYGSELMTGYLNGGANPLSRITAASMADLGYPNVNVDAADLYQLPSSASDRNRLPFVDGLTGVFNAPSSPDGLLLTAAQVGDTDGGVTRVSFFREANGIPGLQQGTDTPDELLGIDTAPDAGTLAYTLTLANSTLPDGTSTYYARANDTDGAYSPVRSAAVNYVADTVAPTVATSEFLFQRRQAVRFEFSEPVTNLSASSLTVVDQSTGQTLAGGSFVLDADTTPTTAVFRYANGILADGNYVATLSANVRDAAGNALGGGRARSFFVLAGDADRSRGVGTADFLILRQNFGRTNDVRFGDGDFNYDGRVGTEDFTILRRKFGVSLPAPSGSLFGDTGIGGGDDDGDLTA